MVDLTVIVANWNTMSWVINFSAKVVLSYFPGVKLVVVDQGSSDRGELLALTRQHSERVKLLFYGRNYGPGKAWNDGIRLSETKYVCLLNSDAWPAPAMHLKGAAMDSLELMQQTLADDAMIGLTGPMCDNIASIQAAPDPVDRPNFEIPPGQVMPFVCVMFKRSLVQEIGMLAERFYGGGSEDTEYCTRVRKAGYKIMVTGRAFCRHALNQAYKANNLDSRQVQAEMEKLLAQPEQIKSL